jgi:hypothetical protein
LSLVNLFEILLLTSFKLSEQPTSTGGGPFSPQLGFLPPGPPPEPEDDMPKIHCSIHVTVEHEDDPKAAIVANNAILSLIRKAEKLGKTDSVTRTGSGGMLDLAEAAIPEPDPEFDPPAPDARTEAGDPTDQQSITDEQSILSAG